MHTTLLTEYSIILAGDFNHADPKRVFTKLLQHIDFFFFLTRQNNTLDDVYST